MVSQRALVERHVALEQLEIERDVEAVAEGIGDGLVGRDCLIFISGTDANPRCVSVTRRVDALVLVIFPLQGCLPEIAVTVEDVTIVDGHHLVAGDFDHSLLHDGSEPGFASSLFSVILKARRAVPGTITSCAPRFGNRTSSC